MSFLTNVFDNIDDGGLEELVHGFLCQPQHPLGRPPHDVHADTHTEERVCVCTVTEICCLIKLLTHSLIVPLSHTHKHRSQPTLTCSSSGRPPRSAPCVSYNSRWKRRAGRCWGRWPCPVPPSVSSPQMRWWGPPRPPAAWLWSSGWNLRQRSGRA